MFMGGLFILSSMDYLQLQPIDGRPPILSPFMISSFRFFKLDLSVRACDDRDLRRIQEITRLPNHELDDDIIEEFCFLIKTCCTFVRDWKELGPHVLRIFSKKAAVHKAEIDAIAQVKNSNIRVLSKEAIDSESNLNGNWMKATKSTTMQLNNLVKEPQVLHFYEKALFEVTFNKDGKFSHTQLAMLFDMPTEEQLQQFQSIRMLLAPEECLTTPKIDVTKEQLLAQKWKEEDIPTAPEHYNYTVKF